MKYPIKKYDSPLTCVMPLHGERLMQQVDFSTGGKENPEIAEIPARRWFRWLK